MPTAVVTCSRKGTVLATYRFPIPVTLDDRRVAKPTHDDLKAEAKSNLASQGLATSDDWDEIEFDIKCEP